MVFVKDFKKDFYEVIQHQNPARRSWSAVPLSYIGGGSKTAAAGKLYISLLRSCMQRVLVLVGLDIDAICACRILQYLFQCDQVLYTIVPVRGQQELERAYVENSEGVQFVIMLNCGASVDVVELLQPEEHVIFFICDSHRPVDIHNIFNQVQIRLLMRQDEFEDVPDFEEVFREEESDDDSGNDSDGSEPSGKRQRFDADKLERRREKRLWEEKRSKILFEYTEFSGFGTSAALLMFEMAWKMSKDTNDLLWLSVVGVTSQYLRDQVDRDKYIEDVDALQSHVSRHNHRVDDEENSLSVDSLRIAFDQELRVCLYRHWSLFESLCHTPKIACKFRLWTLKGKKRLHEFLADMGLPLVKCRQKYSSMEVHLKEEIKERIKQQLDKYNFREQDLFLPSFHAQYGYRNKVCAMDVVYAAESTLESIEKDNSASTNFLHTMDVLSRTNVEALEKALESARLQHATIMSQVTGFLDMNQIISAGPFLYAFVIEGTADGRFFSKSICLQRLARITLQAYCANSKNKRASTLPLVLGAPYDREKGTTLVVGIPPASDSSCKNLLGKAFEQAATSTKSRTNHDFFDTNVIEIKTEDKSKFLDALISLMS